MCRNSIFLFILCCLIHLVYNDYVSLNASYFDQRVDHFDPTNLRTFKQRYWVDVALFNDTKQSPVFLVIGSESEFSVSELYNGLYLELSEKAGALRIGLEHRFYGKSIPTSDLSVKNLKNYFNVRQMIADLSEFIQFIKNEFNLTKSNKWVSFGCSYSGSLSALLRSKHPNIVHAAFAGSAPMKFRLNFVEYSLILERIIDSRNRTCRSELAKAYAELDRLLRTVEGRDIIRREFVPCTSLDEPYDRLMFLKKLFYDLCQMQFGYNLDLLCDSMLNETYKEPLLKYGEFVRASNSDYCVDTSFKNFVKYFKNDSIDFTDISGRHWMFQGCNEFGYFQTTRRPGSTFSSLLTNEIYMILCREIYGSAFTKARIDRKVSHTARYYESDNFRGTRVFFMYGSLDPWMSLGHLKNSTNVVSLVVEGAVHCEEYGIKQSKHVLRANDFASDIILNKWLKENI